MGRMEDALSKLTDEELVALNENEQLLKAFKDKYSKGVVETAAEKTAKVLPGIARVVSGGLSPSIAVAAQQGDELGANPRGKAIQIANQAPAGVGAIVPMAAAALTGGVSVPASAGLAAAGSAAGATAGELIKRAVGEPSAPVSVFGKQLPPIPGVPLPVSNVVEQGAVGAATDVAGAGLAGLLGKAVKGLKGMFASSAAKKAAAQSSGAPAKELKRIYSESPEVTTPGYFEERIDTFRSDLAKTIKKHGAVAGKTMEKALGPIADKPVMKLTDLKDIWQKQMADLDLKAFARENKLAARDLRNMVAELEKRGQDVTYRNLIAFEDAMYAATKRAEPEIKRAAARIKEQFDAYLKSAPKLMKARARYHEYLKDADVLEDALGVTKTPQKDVLTAPARTESAVQGFLGQPEPTKDAIRSTLDRLGPKATERLEKLAAAGAGEGRLSATQPALPSVGAANVGWSMANPAAAAQALGATALVRKATGSTVRRNLLTGAAKAEKALPAVLPGLRYAPGIARIKDKRRK